MKLLGLPIAGSLAIAACSIGTATWSADVCGCSPAWQSLAIELGVDQPEEPEQLTLAFIQEAASRQVGQPLVLDRLPDTGSGDSCSVAVGGARCAWKLWSRNGSLKGYEAIYQADAAGRISSVIVAERIWAADSGT